MSEITREHLSDYTDELPLKLVDCTRIRLRDGVTIHFLQSLEPNKEHTCTFGLDAGDVKCELNWGSLPDSISEESPLVFVSTLYRYLTIHSGDTDSMLQACFGLWVLRTCRLTVEAISNDEIEFCLMQGDTTIWTDTRPMRDLEPYFAKVDDFS